MTGGRNPAFPVGRRGAFRIGVTTSSSDLPASCFSRMRTLEQERNLDYLSVREVNAGVTGECRSDPTRRKIPQVSLPEQMV
jgi:hypothetical protein